MDNPILECKNLSKFYGIKTVLNDLNLTIGRGRIVGLLGPNGSGKTTLIKMANELLTPTKGEILINSMKPSVETKAIVSYLPERTYFNDYQTAEDIMNFFEDFFSDFSKENALKMLSNLNINPKDKLKHLSKGTKEKIQLVMVMSRKAQLYLLDEPIAGVDPAARDYILKTILSNYNPGSTIIMSTHLITDIEQILDEVVFVGNGGVLLHKTVDEIRQEQGKSVDSLFREVFRC